MLRARSAENLSLENVDNRVVFGPLSIVLPKFSESLLLSHVRPSAEYFHEDNRHGYEFRK